MVPWIPSARYVGPDRRPAPALGSVCAFEEVDLLERRGRPEPEAVQPELGRLARRSSG
jgi:hypothetical protein